MAEEITAVPFAPPATEPTTSELPAVTVPTIVRAAPRRPRVVIVGAGFGGLSAARAFSKKPVDVLVLDRNNYHGFWPLLYQVATAGLEPESIAYPVRGILREYPNATFQMAEVTGIDMDVRQVQTVGGPIDYDYLVLSAGSTNNYFGNDNLASNTFGMKDIEEASHLRARALTCFEEAVRETDVARQAALLTFVVIGGGPTGVELAGAFIELVNYIMRKDYPMLNRALARVVLVENSEHILAPFPESLRRSALKRLEKIGVEVKLKTGVASVDGTTVTFRDGGTMHAGTVIWAAGVRASPLADALRVATGKGGRVQIAPTLDVPGHPDVFIIGDMAYLEGYKPGVAYPMIAPVAIQMGEQTAANILAHIAGRPLRPFRYFDKGQMATIGRSAAVLDAFGIRLTGFIAWLGWLFVHLMFLVGFRNRVIVLINWAYNYFTYDRGVRLIFGDTYANRPKE